MADPHLSLASSSAELPAPRPWLAAAALTEREIVRFLRQRNRVIGALGQPLVFWLLFGAGLDRSYQLGAAGQGSGATAAAYLFPGTLVLILLFTAIFATISIIEDRREGFLQAVLVAPAPRWSMVLGKVLGGALLALGQGLIFLALALTLEIDWRPGDLVALVALMFLTAVGLTALGFVIAWRMESTQGFHAIMSLVLLPMWLLSGAFFAIPTPGASLSAAALHWTMRLNPLTYAVEGARQLLLGEIAPPAADAAAPFWSPSLTTCWLVTLLFTAAMLAAAWAVSSRRTTGDLV